MRSELGKMTLDSTFEERDALNVKIVQARPPPPLFPQEPLSAVLLVCFAAILVSYPWLRG